MKANPIKVQKLAGAALPKRTVVNGRRRLAVAQTPVLNESVAVQCITQVEARMDVGWGNALFIRGEGAGLSWEKGTPMACVDAATWVWLTSGVGAPVKFKVLLNDEVWAGGDDQVVEPGARIVVEPVF